jgi:hypothetical protein
MPWFIYIVSVKTYIETVRLISILISKFHGLMIFRLIDLTTRHRAETEMETERLRSAQIQAERMLETRERAHRAKVKGLEETVSIQ